MLRDEIAKIIDDERIIDYDGEILNLYAIADSILSLPSGIEAVGKCDICFGRGKVDNTLFPFPYPEMDCTDCRGSGFISRPVSIGEAVELIGKINGWEIVNGHQEVLLISGEILRIKKG